MYKIIGGDQKEYGPVSVEEIRRWIAEGRANSQTIARQETSGTWKPLSCFAEFSDSLSAHGTPPPIVTGEVAAPWSQHILARYTEVRIGQCLASSWRLLLENFPLLFGATFFVWLIGALCEFVPLFGIGKLAYWIFRGVLYGGVYLVFLRRIRGQPASVGDAFHGFTQDLAQLLLAGVVSSILSGIGWGFCVLPGLYLMIAWTFAIPLIADKRMEFWSAMELSRKMVTRVWFELFALLLLAFLPYILTNIFAFIKLFMIAFAMVQQVISGGAVNLEQIIKWAAQLATALLPLALLMKFVLLLNLPFALGALMYAYEDLFGTRPAPAA